MIARPALLALIRARRRARAIAWGAAKDPVCAARLELHEEAVAGFDRRPDLAKRYPADAVRSLAAVGRGREAVDLGRAAATDPTPALALALAPLDPELALVRYAGPRPELRAALTAAAGRTDAALALAATSADADARFQEASHHRLDPARAREAWTAGFGAYGLTPPEPIDPSAPITVVNACVKPGLYIDGDRISVIMPCRNAAPYVTAAVRSVLDQTWRNLEFLFVDDASTDDTAARAEAAADGDPRFTLIRRDQRGGAYRARNTALAQATGRWVAVHDSDEWSHPDRLARQVEDMTRGGLIAVTHRSLRVDAEGAIRARGVWTLARWAPSTLMFERAPVMDRAGVFDEVFSGADNEYWWRLTQLFGPHRVGLSKTPLILGAWRSDSLTGAADSGFGGAGYNLDRLDYWRRWSLWHAQNLGRPSALRLQPGDRPFPVADAMTMKDA